MSLRWARLLTALLCHGSIITSAQTLDGTWQTLPSIGQGVRAEHSVVALDTDQSIYILGGLDATGHTISRVERYSIPDRTWRVTAPLPDLLNHVNAAAVRGQIYVLGALLDNGDQWDAIGDTLVYSPTEDAWSQKSSMPEGTARGASAVGVYNGKVVVAGGQTYIHLQDSSQDALRTVSAYDVDADVWSELPPLPEPRQHVSGGVVGSTFYVIGGRTTGQEKVQSSTYALDLENVDVGWQTLQDMPTARGGLACSVVATAIYCFGGEGDTTSSTGVFDEVEVFDTITDQWSRLAAMPNPRHGFVVATIDKTIYVPGGSTKMGTAPTDYFDSFTVADDHALQGTPAYPEM
jgi:N-acetylneuraminic acid mutarotase